MIIEEPFISEPTENKDDDQIRRERRERRRELKRRFKTLAGGVQMLRSVDIEAGTYDAAEVKEEPWTGPYLLERPILPMTTVDVPSLFEVGQPSTVEEPLTAAKEAVPKPNAPELMVPGLPVAPWVVAARRRDHTPILNTDSISEDSNVGLGMLKMMCLPADMDAIPSDYVEAMNHMFTSMARAGQAAVGVRDLLAKHFQLTMRWEARARRAEA